MRVLAGCFYGACAAGPTTNGEAMYKEIPNPAVSARLTAFAEKAYDSGTSYEWVDWAGQLALDTYEAANREKFLRLIEIST